MNKQLIFKEWKEKVWIPLFALGFLVLFAALAFFLSPKKEFMDFLAGTILFIFLPITATVLGSSAFGSEFKDGAWTYLFSRPLKKSTIWISKFTALLALLAGILIVYYLFLPWISGFEERIMDSSLWSVSFILSLSMFLVSFSLSFLFEKPFYIVFLSFIIFALFGAFPWEIFKIAPYSNFDISIRIAFLIFRIWLVIAVAFGISSLIAFCRTDFSQSRSKVKGFLKAGALGLLLAIFLVAIGFQFSSHRLTFLRTISDEKEMVFNSSRGIFRFDPDRNRVLKLKGKSSGFTFMVADGGKIAWFDGPSDTEWKLKLTDADGKNERTLLVSKLTDPLIAGQTYMDMSLSGDGQTILILSRHEKDRAKLFLWSIKTSGSDLENIPVDFPPAEFARIINWTSDSRQVLLGLTLLPEKNSPRQRTVRYYALSPASGELRDLPAGIRGISDFGPSPDGNRLGYFGRTSPDPDAPRDVLRLFDVQTASETDLCPGSDPVQACWSPTGDRIALLAEGGRKLVVISFAEKKILAERVLESANVDSRIPGTMAWTGDGRHIALSAKSPADEYRLQVYGPSLDSEKSYSIPTGRKPMDNLPHVYGAGEKIVVFDFTNSRVWSFDPAKELWKKLF